MDLGLGPDEGASGLIVSFDEGVDVRDEVFDAGEGGAVERPSGEDREPDFDLMSQRRGSACNGNERYYGV